MGARFRDMIEEYAKGRSVNERIIAPLLSSTERIKLYDALKIGVPHSENFPKALRELAKEWSNDHESLPTRAACLLIADLSEQGWQIKLKRERIVFEPPGLSLSAGMTIGDVKERIRKALQVGRDRQLEEPSVRRFITRMERPFKRSEGKFSVLDLVDDGQELANLLKKIGGRTSDRQDAELARLFRPEIEIEPMRRVDPEHLGSAKLLEACEPVGQDCRGRKKGRRVRASRPPI